MILELAGLIEAITGFAQGQIQEKAQRSEVVIKLLKDFGLDPEHPPADFTAVYQYTLVAYGVGKRREDTRTWQCIQTLDSNPYAGTTITGATGLTPAQRLSMVTLGAIDHSPTP
ncbi:hypothetical protein [Prochlorothrix hollandica]|uniref:NACHT N-terminal helical domain-containing protein n=1 Tax=Prochlorothrix hollandica PCC 9006 = CALU 1027 TaxID=317619 RepID=A0A0M2PWT8_PROHO|nr:hypothetical protein [Prochlorothrix hollandica]KKJ00645.1 hypothetical protein PROH_04895 [Prochlorothrix hollandica PCC 9006 = CALU 1027]